MWNYLAERNLCGNVKSCFLSLMVFSEVPLEKASGEYCKHSGRLFLQTAIWVLFSFQSILQENRIFFSVYRELQREYAGEEKKKKKKGRGGGGYEGYKVSKCKRQGILQCSPVKSEKSNGKFYIMGLTHLREIMFQENLRRLSSTQ